MHIDVEKAIKELLYEKEVVIIPNLGGLVGTPAPASVDYVGGRVGPPSKKMEFNPNLVTNDGVLTKFIEQEYTVSFREAVAVVSAFVAQAKEALDRREMVEIQGVGRLYRDYEQHLRFIPEDENFDVNSFGLPAVSFSPLERSKSQPVEPVIEVDAKLPVQEPPVTTDKAEIAEPPKTPSPLLQRYLPWIAGSTAVLLALLLFMIYSNDGRTPRIPESDRVNISPKNDPPSGTPPPATGTPDASDDTPENDAQAQESPNPPGNTSPPPAAEPAKEAFIVVHSFGVKRNADNFFKALSDAGYRAESRRWNGLHRVGILLMYKDPSEIDRMKQELGAAFKAGPKLFGELEQ